jgi:phosphate transport system ATP-binding protein
VVTATPYRPGDPPDQRNGTSVATSGLNSPSTVAGAVNAPEDAAAAHQAIIGDAPLKADVNRFSFYYGSFKALKDINMPVAEKRVTALIGPSGCGKSTLLRSFNRMHDLYAHNRYEGQINLLPDGINLVGPELDPIEIRMRCSMVFQKPNPFPKSIYENVAYGLRVRGVNDRRYIDDRVEYAIRGAALWDEVKDRLHSSGQALSGGQQQRLCIARALATDPEILLFDEPTAALDPLSTTKIEDLLTELCQKVTILIVTHNMHQAARISHFTAFMYLGELIEFDETEKIFTNPTSKMTEQYVTGRFG